MTAECVEACHATTPTTAAEKRCAMSATTRSSSAFDRSIRMQAIRMEIVAKQVSAAELFTGDDRRSEQDQRIGRQPPFYARTCPNIATGTQIQKLVRLRAADSPRLGRKTRTACVRPFLSGAPGTGREFVTVLTRRRDRSNKIYRPARPLRVGAASHGPLGRLENSPLVRHLKSGSVAFPPSNS